MGPDLTVGETVHGYRVCTVETDDGIAIRLAHPGPAEGIAEITRAITARTPARGLDTACRRAADGHPCR
ncbi:hypothetical protein Natpe_4001 (plasmid) [Natrinema pellirubrum DSM 15624]|uniref:Uncharacterized protein n=1 Tax=Natrinema pellirubrum (strain DSM 15624 / CIP 106293 / JCM 10476 / NCIMB 786 / 157) TaxID=797303 RepID=L0JQD4_NATP1|nr:hypothetical protein Natpe_4001 [Natrinema pellirubrum DSM 15624]